MTGAKSPSHLQDNARSACLRTGFHQRWAWLDTQRGADLAQTSILKAVHRIDINKPMSLRASKEPPPCKTLRTVTRTRSEELLVVLEIS